MEAIEKSVALAVAATMKEMVGAGLGGAGGQSAPKVLSMPQIVENIIKRQDKFVKDRFQDWKFRLEMAAKGNSVVLARLMKWAEERDAAVDLTTDISGEDQELNYNLYYILAQLCEGEAFDVVKNVPDQNGAEAYRKLCRRFLGKTRGKRLHLIRKGVNPPKIKKLSEVMGAIEKWEINVRRLQTDFKEEMSNGLKTGILLEMLPVDVAEHMAQKVADDDKYEEVKEQVLRYVETKADYDGVAMDIGAVDDKSEGKEEEDELYYVKGKGKGGPCFVCGEQGHLARDCPKGKGKGKDSKGKGKGFQGECWQCGEHGHSAKFCPKGQVKGYGKDKGYQKGFGKNKGGDYGYKGGKGKGWGAYAMWEDPWGEWPAAQLPICGVEEGFTKRATVPTPPGLACSNRFAAFADDHDDDQRDSDVANIMDDFVEDGGDLREDLSCGCRMGPRKLGPGILRGTSLSARTSVPPVQYSCEVVPPVSHAPHDDVLDQVKEVRFVEVQALFNPEEEVNHIKVEPKWEKLEAVVDSGAAESVAPSSMAPWVPVRPSEGSTRGQCYMSASGAKLPNQGEKKFSMMTPEGNWAEATFQVADVTRPLCSVTKICDKGNRVVFEGNGGYIENLETGVCTTFGRQNNVYVMEMWAETSGFSRQGA